MIINHFTDTDLYKLTMCCAIVDNFPNAIVKYEFVDRNNTVYPEHFDAYVRAEIKCLEYLTITEQEINFMKEKCSYLPQWFFTYLRGFRFNSKLAKVEQDAEGHLHITFEGLWAETVLLEVMVLAIVSELYYNVTGLDELFDYEKYYAKSLLKASQMVDNNCVWADFGTRRRSSFETEEVALKAMLNATHNRLDMLSPIYQKNGKCVGTSNVYLAMKYNVTPIGTMAHEWISGIAGLYNPLVANKIAMEKWRHTFHGALGTYLYDTYGFDAFARNFNKDFANSFDGLRIDSGDNFEQFKKICDKYNSLGINPKEKTIIFSNALSIDDACKIQQTLGKDFPKISYGIGTAWTNDWSGIADEIKPMNIVIKLLAIKENNNYEFFSDTCKISEDKGKHTGREDVVEMYKKILHME